MEKNKISIDELKKIQIKILDYVSSFCEENNIKYWLDCGTLLGAVRHKGYIPWDDDIDIGMLRQDYELFMKLFNNNSNNYKFLCYESDASYSIAFGKVYDTNTILYEPDKKTGEKKCVNIDVFVYDNAPNDIKEQKKIYRKKEKYRVLNSLRIYKKFPTRQKQKYNIFRYPFFYILKLFPKRYFLKKQIKISKKYINKHTDYIGNYSSKTNMVCNKRVFDSFVYVEFEGKKYKAPNGFDEYLTNFYGDYMKLPPKEKQVSHHQFEAYYK